MSRLEIARGSHSSMTSRRADDRADNAKGKKQFATSYGRKGEVRQKIQPAGQASRPEQSEAKTARDSAPVFKARRKEAKVLKH
jgi:hypothetical protein